MNIKLVIYKSLPNALPSPSRDFYLEGIPPLIVNVYPPSIYPPPGENY